jgi:hypothetical protein
MIHPQFLRLFYMKSYNGLVRLEMLLLAITVVLTL